MYSTAGCGIVNLAPTSFSECICPNLTEAKKGVESTLLGKHVFLVDLHLEHTLKKGGTYLCVLC
jgi:hypothetical protein